MIGICLAEEWVLFRMALEMDYLCGEMGIILCSGFDLCLLKGDGTLSSKFWLIS
jgi:hypothetical protein